jgi:xanthine dehydrogenase YagT iron-sulfur-binding subunit
MPDSAAVGIEGLTTHVEITLHVNGSAKQMTLDSRISLLDALREHLDLTGTKKGCDQRAARALYWSTATEFCRA